MIDKRAVIDAGAKIAGDVAVGPFSVIGADVEIDSGTWIGSHVVIKGPTRIGHDNKIFQFASIGDDPQDVKYQGERTQLNIGDRNTFREFCTINRGTVQGGGVTTIENDNLFLAYTHVAHDCHIHNHTIFANNASLAGHVEVDDYVVLGGFSAIYQFCRLGKHSFLSGASLVMKDVLPFTKVAVSKDTYAKPFGLNTVGLRRRGFSAETIQFLKRGYRIIYREGLTIEQAIPKLQTMLDDCPEIALYIEALQRSLHGILR